MYCVASMRNEYTFILGCYRYKMLCKKTWPIWKGRAIDGVREIMRVGLSVALKLRWLTAAWWLLIMQPTLWLVSC